MGGLGVCRPYGLKGAALLGKNHDALTEHLSIRDGVPQGHALPLFPQVLGLACELRLAEHMLMKLRSCLKSQPCIQASETQNSKCWPRVPKRSGNSTRHQDPPRYKEQGTVPPLSAICNAFLGSGWRFQKPRTLQGPPQQIRI